MGRQAEKWERRVRKCFDFLLEHGYVFASDDDTSRWQTNATYRARRLGIEIADSRELNRVEIDLIRLHDGRLPEPQIWVSDAPISRTLLDTVLEARRHSRLHELQALSTQGTDEQLATWARMLQEAAPEVLHDDDAPIADAEVLVRQRVAEHPQEIVVWLPHDASEQRQREASAEAEQRVPKDVTVRVRRYER